MSTASEQAQRFAATLGNVQTAGTLPPILDLETTGGLSAGDLVTWAQVFTETLRTITGRTPMVYTYVSFWNVQMAGTQAFTRTYRVKPADALQTLAHGFDTQRDEFVNVRLKLNAEARDVSVSDWLVPGADSRLPDEAENFVLK